ncbi:MAG: hypothetical protein H6772_01700 [Pseudomonadales bacterium]|nr:hypothetical protein [Pseudomonadales bacterium]
MKNVLNHYWNTLTKLNTKKYFIFLFLFSLITYSFNVIRVKSIIWGDSLYYYSYTNSIIVDHDLNFQNEAYRKDFGFPNPPQISSITNKVINKFSPGAPILWMPAFLVGQLISGSLNFLGLISYVDGYNFLTQYLVAVSTIYFSVLGLYFLYKLLLIFFKKRIALLTILFIYLTTQMFYYTAIDPLNSHSASFMLSSLFLYLVVIFSKQINWQRMILLGLIGGMMALVRNQDIVLLIPTSIFIFTLKSQSLMERLNRIVLFWGNVFLVLSVQILITLNLYGQFGSPYLIGGEHLSWFKPDFLRVLFSFENGLFFFSPILVVGLSGLFIMLKTQKNHLSDIKKVSLFRYLCFISIFVFLFQLYVVASWEREIIGGPYGSRMFISVLPHLTLGLAFMFDKFKNRKYFLVFTTMSLCLLFANNILQTIIMLFRF